MKYLFLILFVISGMLLNAQIKILFDATKAEMAGYGDWVIDADVWNIGFNYGVPETGTDQYHQESNPQRYPAPAQSGITSTTPESFWTGGLSAWAVDCVKKGYIVETLPFNGHITYGNTSNAQDLSNYKVFIVDEPNILFTDAEKSALIHFVQNGGGLFMIADHVVSDRNNDGWDSPNIWNNMADTNSIALVPFGIKFDLNNFSGNFSNVANLPTDPILHGIMGSVTKVKWSVGASMTLDPTKNSSVKGIVYKSGTSGNTNVLAAYATYGSGKVFAMSDSSPAEDGTGDPADGLYDGWITDANGNHERLIMNATIWLASNSTTVSQSELNDFSIQVIPNPIQSSAIFRIGGSEQIKDGELIVYDMLGKEITKIAEINEHEIVFNKGMLQKGFYFFQLNNNQKPIGKGKFIIE